MKASILITTFVVVILGVIMVGIIATQSNTNTTPTSVTDESLSIATARLASANINESKTFTLTNAGLAEAGGWVTNSVVITNSSGTTLVGNYTVNYATDTITFANNTYTVAWVNNGTLVDYQYYPSNYLVQSFGRNISNMISGFLAIMILIGVIAGVYFFLKTTQRDD